MGNRWHCRPSPTTPCFSLICMAATLFISRGSRRLCFGSGRRRRRGSTRNSALGKCTSACVGKTVVARVNSSPRDARERSQLRSSQARAARLCRPCRAFKYEPKPASSSDVGLASAEVAAVQTSDPNSSAFRKCSEDNVLGMDGTGPSIRAVAENGNPSGTTAGNLGSGCPHQTCPFATGYCTWLGCNTATWGWQKLLQVGLLRHGLLARPASMIHRCGPRRGRSSVADRTPAQSCRSRREKESLDQSAR